MEWKLGETIARCRKQKGLTQEQLARAVGVSSPAVSKWETGSSCPDIMLLPPIARALGITVDSLLSFREGPSEAEIAALSTELQTLFVTQGFAAGQARCEELLHEYPNSMPLKLAMANLYQTMLGSLTPEDLTEERIREIWGQTAKLFEDVRNDGDPQYFTASTVGLAAFRLMEGKLEETERLLSSLPKTDVDPDELYPSLYLAQGKTEQAEKLLETRLFQLVRSAGLSLHSLAAIAKTRGDLDRALFFCDLGLQLSHLFEEDDFTILQSSAELLLKQGKNQQAMDCLEQYGEGLLHYRTDYDDHPIFSQIGLHIPREKVISSLRLSVKALELDEALAPLRDDPRFQRLLKRLADQTKNDL